MQDVDGSMPAGRAGRGRQLRACAAALTGCILVGVSVAGARWASLASSRGASAPSADAITLTPGDVRDIHHLARLKAELSEDANLSHRRSGTIDASQPHVDRKGAVQEISLQGHKQPGRAPFAPDHANSGTNSAPPEVDQQEPEGAALVDHNSKDAALLARLKAQLHTLNLEQRHLEDSSYVEQGTAQAKEAERQFRRAQQHRLAREQARARAERARQLAQKRSKLQLDTATGVSSNSPLDREGETLFHQLRAQARAKFLRKDSLHFAPGVLGDINNNINNNNNNININNKSNNGNSLSGTGGSGGGGHRTSEEEVKGLLREIQTTRQNDQAQWGDVRQALAAQQARDGRNEARTHQLAKALDSSLHGLTRALGRLHSTEVHQLAAATSRTDAKVTRDTLREEAELERATRRQDAMNAHVQGQLGHEQAKVGDFKAKFQTKLAALTAAIGKDDKEDDSQIQASGALETRQRSRDASVLQQQVLSEMKALEHEKQELSMELEGIMAVSRSEDAGLKDDLASLQHTAAKLSDEADVSKATLVAREIGDKESKAKLQHEVVEWEEHVSNHLRSLRDGVDHSAQQRARLEAELQQQMRTLSENVTAQEGGVQAQLTRLRNSNAVLEQHLRSQVDERASAASATIAHLDTKVTALEEDTQVWAKTTQDKQEAAQEQETDNEDRLARLSAFIRSQTEDTEREINKIKSQDKAFRERILAQALQAEQHANCSHVSLQTEIANAESRIESRLASERAYVLARISDAQISGQASREDLGAQLNATVAATGNMLKAYQATVENAVESGSEDLSPGAHRTHARAAPAPRSQTLNARSPVVPGASAGSSAGESGGGRGAVGASHEEEEKADAKKEAEAAEEQRVAAAARRQEEEEKERVEARRARIREKAEERDEQRRVAVVEATAQRAREEGQLETNMEKKRRQEEEAAEEKTKREREAGGRDAKKERERERAEEKALLVSRSAREREEARQHMQEEQEEQESRRRRLEAAKASAEPASEEQEREERALQRRQTNEEERLKRKAKMEAAAAVQLETRRAREEQHREIRVVSEQRQAREEARDKRRINSWRTQQMESWHEQIERERRQTEEEALATRAHEERAQARIRLEKREIGAWTREQRQAWSEQRARETERALIEDQQHALKQQIKDEQQMKQLPEQVEEQKLGRQRTDVTQADKDKTDKDTTDKHATQTAGVAVANKHESLAKQSEQDSSDKEQTRAHTQTQTVGDAVREAVHQQSADKAPAAASPQPVLHWPSSLTSPPTPAVYQQPQTSPGSRVHAGKVEIGKGGVEGVNGGGMEKAQDTVGTWGPVREAEHIRRERELKRIKRRDSQDYSNELSFDRKQARAREAARQEAAVEHWRSQAMESWHVMQQARTLKREQGREAKEQSEQNLKDKMARSRALLRRSFLSHDSSRGSARDAGHVASLASSPVWKAARGLVTKEVTRNADDAAAAAKEEEEDREVEEGEELAEKPGVDSFAHVAVVPAAHPAGIVSEAKGALHEQGHHLKLPAWAQAYLGGCISCH